MTGETVIAAHRGGAELWPENSLQAFRGAIDLGIEQIETDVHLSRDNELVIIHDARLERTTLGQGIVGDYTWPTLQTTRLRDAGEECIPHFEQLIDLIEPTDISLRLEIKVQDTGARYPGIESKVIERLQIRKMLQRTVFTSFDWDTLATIRELEPHTPLIGLIGRDRYKELGSLSGVFELASAYGLPQISVPVDLLTSESIATAQSRGIRLGVHAVKTKEQIQWALDCCVAAFTTDRPDLALELRRARRAAGN